MDLGLLFLESELGQKWRYGVLKTCIYRLKLVSSEVILIVHPANANNCTKF